MGARQKGEGRTCNSTARPDAFTPFAAVARVISLARPAVLVAISPVLGATSASTRTLIPG